MPERTTEAARRARGRSRVSSSSSAIRWKGWIPACAGMTSRRAFRVSLATFLHPFIKYLATFAPAPAMQRVPAMCTLFREQWLTCWITG